MPSAGLSGEGVTRWNLRQHFQARHHRDLVNIPGEGVFPKCDLCGMQTNPMAFGHWRTALCRQGRDMKCQREAAVCSARALQQQFTTYGVPLEHVEVFKYLGRLMSYDDRDTRAVNSNLKKARKCWARILCVLRSKNATARVSGMFYKATVQAVLLFGSKT